MITPITFPRHVSLFLISAAQCLLDAAGEREDSDGVRIQSKIKDAERWLERARDHYNPPPAMTRAQDNLATYLRNVLADYGRRSSESAVWRMVDAKIGIGAWQAFIKNVEQRPMSTQTARRRAVNGALGYLSNAVSNGKAEDAIMVRALEAAEEDGFRISTALEFIHEHPLPK